MSAAKCWAFNEPTVADRCNFDALPDDVQRMVVRLYGRDFREYEPATGVEPSVASLKDAFAAGWEAACEAMEHPYFSDSAFDYWQKRRQRDEQRRAA